MKLTALLTTLSLTTLTAARCTREDNVSFALNPWNATTTTFSQLGWSISLDAKNPTNPSAPRDAILTRAISTLPPPFFSNRGIWIYQTGSSTKKMRGFMYQTDAVALDKGWTWKWANEAEIAKLDPKRVKKEFWDIGCVYEGRHFLMLNGAQKWQVCKPWGKGEWKLMQGVTREGLQCVDSVNFWVDYVRPV